MCVRERKTETYRETNNRDRTTEQCTVVVQSSKASRQHINFRVKFFLNFPVRIMKMAAKTTVNIMKKMVLKIQFILLMH